MGNTLLVVVMLLGIAGIIGSVLIGDILISTLLGVFSFSSFWTIKEIFEQRERVLKGWFPMNLNVNMNTNPDLEFLHQKTIL